MHNARVRAGLGLLSMIVLWGCAPSSTAPTDGGCFAFSPEEIDFGELPNRTSGVQELRVVNHTDELLLLKAKSLTDNFSAIPVANPFVDPGGTGTFDVHFFAPDARLHFGELEISGGDRCRQTVVMHGTGSGALETSTKQLLFGGLDIGASKVLDLRITNTRRTPVTVENVRIVDDRPVQAGFAAPFSTDAPSRFELAPMASINVRVTAVPAYASTFTAALVGSSGPDLMRVRITMTGGMPIAELPRTHIDVPLVEFTPIATNPSFVERHFVVRNIGLPNGVPLRFQSPALRVEREDGGIVSEEFELSVPSAINAGSEGTLTLRYVPTEFGLQRFRVILLTNEVEPAEQALTFAATVWPVQQCTLSSPLEAVFTKVADGGAEGEVIFRNEGTTPCVLDDVHVRGSFSRFTVLDGGVEQLELGPGRSHVVSLAGRGVSGIRITGELNFHHLYPNSVNQAVRLVIPP